jgi:hypothetical protein
MKKHQQLCGVNHFHHGFPQQVDSTMAELEFLKITIL